MSVPPPHGHLMLPLVSSKAREEGMRGALLNGNVGSKRERLSSCVRFMIPPTWIRDNKMLGL